MNKVIRKAYAKINLALDVIARRSDGYHEVKMIMQNINLYDELTFEKKTINTGTPQIQIITDSSEIPVDEHNLVYKAAKAIIERYSIPQNIGISVLLNKKIPVAAGMAGGSSDAAAVFHGVNELMDLGIPITTMCEMGKKIGADIPFCIIGGTAKAEGIGEKLTVLPPMPSCHILIIKPDISVSTKWVYENLNLRGIENHPDADGMIAAIENNDLDGITSRMANLLEAVTIKKYPVINEIKSNIMAFGAENALMSGSGPSVFGIFKNKEKALSAFSEMKNKYEIYLTEPMNTELK